jgi:hypothetical protein
MNIYKNLFFFQLLCFLVFIQAFQNNSVFGQQWDNMDDSTYYSIVENRFNKGNSIIGLGGTIKSDYNDLSFFGLGVRSKAGYFIANKWLLTTDFSYYYAWVRETDGNGKGSFYRYLIGLNTRHYFKPKHRTLFIEFGPQIGNETNRTDGIDSIDSFNNFVYGGRLGLGVSVFVRQFELELVAGVQFYGNNYSSENFNNNMYQFLQINISYIFDKQRNRKNKKTRP